MKVEIDELEGCTKNICITLSGDDLIFTVTPRMIAISLDEKTADRISFHLQSILLDRSWKKDAESVDKD